MDAKMRALEDRLAALEGGGAAVSSNGFLVTSRKASACDDKTSARVYSYLKLFEERLAALEGRGAAGSSNDFLVTSRKADAREANVLGKVRALCDRFEEQIKAQLFISEDNLGDRPATAENKWSRKGESRQEDGTNQIDVGCRLPTADHKWTWKGERSWKDGHKGDDVMDRSPTTTATTATTTTPTSTDGFGRDYKWAYQGEWSQEYDRSPTADYEWWWKGDWSQEDGVNKHYVDDRSQAADHKWCRKGEWKWDGEVKEDYVGSAPASHARGSADADAQRAALEVAILSSPSAHWLTPAPISKFSDLSSLPEWIGWVLEENKWEDPTPIQAQALPILFSGQNVVGIAETGSGKTLAYLIPMIIHASAQRPLTRMEPGPIGLCLAPTRELAVQIEQQVQLLCKYTKDYTDSPGGLRSVCFYGGVKKDDQLWSFTSEGAHIAVATLGRLLDVVEERKVTLSRVTFLVVDEADRLLEENFKEDVDKIIAAMRPRRQTAFFSATWSNDVQRLADGLCTDAPTIIRVGGNGSTDDVESLIVPKNIKQEVVVIDHPEGDDKWESQEEEKSRRLCHHINKVVAGGNVKMIVFVNQKKSANDLCEKLSWQGYDVDVLHGDRAQETRLAVLEKYRQDRFRILITTDVMRRGLDVKGVTHVVVYNVGGLGEYVHRIGRTGRGKDGEGHALLFFEHYPKYPQYAKQLIALLKRSGQPVPSALAQLADDVSSGKRARAENQWKNYSRRARVHPGGASMYGAKGKA